MYLYLRVSLDKSNHLSICIFQPKTKEEIAQNPKLLPFRIYTRYYQKIRNQIDTLAYIKHLDKYFQKRINNTLKKIVEWNVPTMLPDIMWLSDHITQNTNDNYWGQQMMGILRINMITEKMDWYMYKTKYESEIYYCKEAEELIKT